MKPIWRCSSLDRNLACHGAQTLEDRIAPRDGEEGLEGTSLHWLAHSRMQLELGAVGDIGPAPQIPKSVAFSSWIAGYYFDFVAQTVTRDWSLEVEAALAYEFDRFILSGHIDSLGMNAEGTEAVFFDLKTSYDPVDPADSNWQVLGYAVLLLKAYPDLRKLTAYIVQPRNDEDDGFARISEPMVLEGDRLANAPASLEAEINAALDDWRTLDDGPRQCKWCRCALQCPATINRRESMKHTLTDAELERIKQTPDDATLAAWVIAKRVLGRPFDDATDMAKERIAANGSLTDGTTTITAKVTGGSYSYPDPLAFLRALRRRLPDEAQLAKAIKFSMSGARDVIAEVTGLPKTSKRGESAQAVVDAELKPLAVQGEKTVLMFQ